MGFAEQLTMLLAIIIVLGVILAGVTIWSRRSGSGDGGGSGGGGFFGLGSLGGGGTESGDLKDQIELEDVMEEYPKPSDRKKERRFDLKGPQAEIAAKVLKRWLRDGEGSKEK